MTYAEALAYIASLEPRGWRLGLDRMDEFARRIGLEGSLGDGESPRFIHIAGTNGKGSTTANVQSLLVEAGVRTGAFFSPFVVSPRERVQFGRQLIEEGELAQITQDLIPIAEGLSDSKFGGVTEFEFKAGLGFEYWKRRRCEWVALEVGLGGRLDATNIVHPSACVITSISLDHTAILGRSPQAIAREKAGIIKPGVPVVIGELPKGASCVVEQICAERGAALWRYGIDVRWDRLGLHTPVATRTGLVPGIQGSKQEVNLALAVAALDAAGVPLSEEQAQLGAVRAFAPGRFQTLILDGRTVVLDGAHNSEAARVLAASIRKRWPGRRVVLVTNMVQGHEIALFYKPLVRLVDRAFIAPIDFHRARDPEETAAALLSLGIHAECCDSVEDAMANALNSDPDALVLVTGSFYLVGDALRLPGLSESRG